MIIDWIKTSAHRLNESPTTRTEVILTAKCDCGCVYQNSYVVDDNAVRTVARELHLAAIKEINHWLATDRHGSQLRPSPIQQSL